MKRLIIFPLVILLTLTSCKTDYIELEARAVVAAIGVDKKEEFLEVTMEIINPDEEDKNAENQIITKSGSNFEEAVGAISASLSKNLFYAHLAVIVFGQGLSARDIQSVFKFCFLSNEFTLLLKVVATKNAQELLKVTPKNEKVLGYEIMSTLNSRQKNLSIGYNNSFINVGGRRDTSPTLYALPFFEVSGEKEESLYSLSGLKLYKDDKEMLTIKDNSAAVFEILSNSFKSGQLEIKMGGAPTLVEIKHSHTKIKVDYKKGQLYITLNLEQTIKNYNGSIDKKDYQKAIENTSNNLIDITKQTGLDLFYIKEYLKRNEPEIFAATKDNFEELLKRAKIDVTLHIKDEANG